MNTLELQKIKEGYVLLARYFGQAIDDDVLLAYANDLADLPYCQAERAMTALRLDPKTTRCPLPSQIRARVTPAASPDNEAILIVGRVIDAIARIGPYETQRAKAAIGPVGWKLVTLEGGWEFLCGLKSDALPTLKAQWRGTAKALIERGADEAEPAQIEHSPRDAGLTSFGDMLAQIAQKPKE